ncbi:MAG: SRPBCC family protein [bacterium]
MKFTLEIEINLPRDKVIELFDNPDNLVEWQNGFVSYEPLEGKPGEEGSTARLRYKMGNRDIEMTETITRKTLPEEFNGTYEAKGVFNIIRNRFIDQGTTTRWISENEFYFTGIMRFLAFFLPGAFRKQSLKYMRNFKTFAEGI